MEKSVLHKAAKKSAITTLESHFEKFRENIVGHDLQFETYYGTKPLVYADWTASGRLYGPIEKRISEEIGLFLGNTHTETSITGQLMTEAYHKAQAIIKSHVNAGKNDVLIFAGTGMTGAVNKFQRILGIRWPEAASKRIKLSPEERPIVFVSHMEHHSNQTSWLESQVDVECIEPNEEGMIDTDNLRQLLKKYESRTFKIAAITACSNVTGIMTDYHQVAKIMHEEGGVCFIDFACSAPYVKINMHPDDESEKLDAIYFSPHKFLGGPGTPGVLIFDSKFYTNQVPDHPGGGTVLWTNPWGGHRYFEDIELREDGGTPGFLQGMKAALAVKLKEEMGIENIMEREHEIVAKFFAGLEHIPGLHILAGEQKNRLGVFSFYFDHVHFELVTKLLNDRFGIQARGGCSCAGTYGHYLLHISPQKSHEITDKIDHGELGAKPGWVRLSIHPTMKNSEIDYIIDAVRQVGKNAEAWSEDYTYDYHTNSFSHKSQSGAMNDQVNSWFDSL